MHVIWCISMLEFHLALSLKSEDRAFWMLFKRFTYCTHSSVYRVSWPSGRVVDCNILILFRHSTTGPEHPIYRNICPQIPNYHCTLKDYKYFAFLFFWRCSDYHSIHKKLLWRCTGGFISDNNLRWIFSDVKIDQNITLFCALADCNHQTMTALFEYSGSLACIL